MESAVQRGISSAGLRADVSPDGGLVAVACSEGKVIVWSVAANRMVQELEHPAISGVAFAPNGTLLASTSVNATVMLWDTRTWRPVCEPLRAHQLAAFFVSFSRDGKRMLTTGGCGEEAVVVWDVATRRQVATLRTQGQIFYDAHFSADGNTITARSEGNLHVWRAPAFEEIAGGGGTR